MPYVDERDLHDSVLAVNSLARMCIQAHPERRAYYEDVAAIVVGDLQAGEENHHLLCYVALILMMKTRTPDTLGSYYRRVRDVQAERWSPV